MVKKILMLGIVAIMLFSLAGCGYPTDKFDSLEEMQEALSDNFASFPSFDSFYYFYYFDFNQEGVKEAGKYEASKASKDGKYIRYSVWYDVEYEIGGQKQERKLRIAATDSMYPMNSEYESTDTYRPIVNEIYISWFDSIDVEGWTGMIFDVNKKVLRFSIVIDANCYYFILEGAQASIIEQELGFFLSICKFAIENRYQITKNN